MQRKEIQRGDLFFYDFGKREGSVQSGERPVMVIQADNFNANPIEMAVLGGASTVFSIAGNPRTTQPPDAEQKSQSFLSLPDKALAFSVVLKGMPTNHFPFCGYSFQNASGNPKGRQFLWPGVIQ